MLKKFNYGESFYQIDYRKRYKDFLEDIKDSDKILCELYLFRAWTTQFYMRLVLGEQQGDEILYEVVNLSNTLGLGIFELYNKLNFAQVMKAELEQLLPEKWEAYDDVYLALKSESSLPTMQICDKFMDFCAIKNASKLILLSVSFIDHGKWVAQEIARIK